MNKGDGYIPHNGMGYFTCPNCGCGEWVSYPQSTPVDRSKTWTYEYCCAKCGKMMGLTLKGRVNAMELHAKAHSADPVQTDMLDEIYHSTGMSPNDYVAHLKIIAKGDE